METAALTSFLFMGLALGLVHAFDPDHIAAVGGLSAGKGAGSSPVSSFRFGLQWSMGHGSALLMVSIVVFVAGSAIPVHLSEYAERSVAFVLIVIGLMAFWRLLKSNSSKEEKGHSHMGAPLVGLLHGTAGSAPLLALIPISQISQPIVGVVYVLFFSVGVILAMTMLGGIFAHSLRMLDRFELPFCALIQGVMAAFSLFLGIYLAVSAF
ncbi:urease accessory protein UreH [Teredinibacter haidensis]|uniref:urease accessory protein UreH n=1 Tax=Teredinibacter haidensis TaxID=2731755 RepID=UPI0009490CF7|nr:urease accessory protein UreH [Teredinibacter haidensis]